MKSTVANFFRGNVQPFVQFLEKNEFVALSARDHKGANELTFESLLLPYFVQSITHLPSWEEEAVQEGGFVYLFLQRTQEGRNARLGYLDLIVELNYLHLLDFVDTHLSPTTLQGMSAESLRALEVTWSTSDKQEGGEVDKLSAKKKLKNVLGSASQTPPSTPDENSDATQPKLPFSH